MVQATNRSQGLRGYFRLDGISLVPRTETGSGMGDPSEADRPWPVRGSDRGGRIACQLPPGREAGAVRQKSGLGMNHHLEGLAARQYPATRLLPTRLIRRSRRLPRRTAGQSDLYRDGARVGADTARGAGDATMPVRMVLQEKALRVVLGGSVDPLDRHRRVIRSPSSSAAPRPASPPPPLFLRLLPGPWRAINRAL